MSLPAVNASVVPDVFAVYTPTALEVRLEVAADLGPGATCSCQLPNSFLAADVSPSLTRRLQTGDPAGDGHVAAELRRRDGTVTPLAPEVRPREFYSGCAVVRHGQCVDAVCGTALHAGDAVVFRFANLHSPWVANQEECVYVAVDGQTPEALPTFRVLPGEAEVVRLIAPSVVRPGECFSLRLVTLDRYHNRSRSTCRDVTVRTDAGDAVAEGLSFTGACTVPVTLDAPGVHRFHALGVRSNPVLVSPDATPVYWGDLHSHSDMSVDAVGHENYAYAEEVSGLEFCAVCDHGAVTHPDNWARAQARARAADRPGRFVPILAYELNLGYHLNLYFPDLEGEMVAVGTAGDSCPVPGAVEALLERRPEILTQLHHTGVQFGVTDMRETFPPTTRLLEIYSQHGQSETYNPDHVLAYENVRRMGPGKVSMLSIDGPYYARDAWALGQRFATMGSSDDHFAQPGKCHCAVTAVRAPTLDRESLMAALGAGACYATTGERILLAFSIGEVGMGGTVRRPSGGQALPCRLSVH
ncbi:MAG: hypothetical protein ACOCX4_10200, partial [Planctomycetota bacterium]